MIRRTLATAAVAAAAGGALLTPPANAAGTPVPGGGTVTIEYDLPALADAATCSTPPTIQYTVRDASGKDVTSLSTTTYPSGTLTWSTGDAGAFTVWASFPKPACPVVDPTPPGVPYRYPVATGRSIGKNNYPGTVTAWQGHSFVSTEVGQAPKRVNSFTFPAGTS